MLSSQRAKVLYKAKSDALYALDHLMPANRRQETLIDGKVIQLKLVKESHRFEERGANHRHYY